MTLTFDSKIFGFSGAVEHFGVSCLVILAAAVLEISC